MEHRAKFAIAAVAGVVSLFAVSAFAQQATPPQGANPPAEKPAINAPAAGGQGQDAAKDNTADAAKAEAGGAAKSEESKTADTTASDKRAKRRHRHSSRHHRGYRGRHHGMRGRDGRRSRMSRRNRWRNMSQEDRKAYFEARLASVKAGLLLNETQAKLWPYVETAVREMAAKRREWRAKIKAEGRPENPFDRMKRRADIMADRAAGMQKFATAAKPLYDTLSDSQKRRLKVLTKGFRRIGKMRAMRRHRTMMRNMGGKRWERRGGHRQGRHGR